MFAPATLAELDGYLRGEGLNPAAMETFVLIEDNRLLRKSEAAFALCAYLKPPWRWLRAFSYLPKSICDWLYDWVAANRIAWFGRAVFCDLEADLQHRLL